MGLLSAIGKKPQAKDVLAEAGAVLDKLGVKWWLSAGTALGFHRDGGFIPHDSDIDVGIEGLPRNLPTAFYKAGFRKHKFERNFQRSFAKDDVLFDIYVFNKSADKMISDTTIGKIIKPYKLFTQLGEIEFAGKKYPVPNPIEDYLEVRFGASWRTPQKSKGKWYHDAPCVEVNELNK